MVIDLTGQKYGRLTVIRRSEGHMRGSTMWECICECGGSKTTSSNRLRTGHVKSCGCLNLDSQRATHTKHGMIQSPEYAAWQNMKRRCLNPSSPIYARYGGRGIGVCSRWLQSFQNFFEDMGKRPNGTSLDRINNDGNYEHGNCRWTDDFEQMNNTRRNRYIEYGGERKTMSQWARLAGVSRFLIRDRIRKGEDPSAVLKSIGVQL